MRQAQEAYVASPNPAATAKTVRPPRREQGGERGGDGREEAPLFVWGVLGDEGGRAGKFSATREPLYQPQQRQQNGGQDADRAVGRQQTDDHGRPAHDQDDHCERRPTPDAVAQITPEHSAHRAREKRHPVEREGGDDSSRPVARGKEERRNNRHRIGVDRKVVPLHEVAHTPRSERPDSSPRSPDLTRRRRHPPLSLPLEPTYDRHPKSNPYVHAPSKHQPPYHVLV
jgi:hypothetical protein